MIKTSLNQIANFLDTLGIEMPAVHYHLPPAALVRHTLLNGQGTLTDTGALMCDTGEFTGRSPQDRFIVRDELTESKVWWGNINIGFSPAHFDVLYADMMAFLSEKELFVRDAFAGADQRYQMPVRFINTLPWQNLFVYNMFIRPSWKELEDFSPMFTVIAAPEFQADPNRHGTRAANFAVLNLTRKIILIGGTAYTGEIKKGVFSALNFLLPVNHDVLPMHCSANADLETGQSAIFFGLSGTGKTTLSTDPNRALVGDDEHGWSDSGVFNFEGGCYAKVIQLSEEKEPQIWNAIKFGALLENTRFHPRTLTVDYDNGTVTENTRVSYPIHHIAGAVEPSVATHPKHIFFLTCDASGVLPPVSRLTKEQAMYHFMSGYTAKVAGTELGITEPKTVFSACFGAPFLPLHPAEYARMLGEKMDEYQSKVWLINTGWSGGAYGVGKRMPLAYTRAIVTAVLKGELDSVEYVQDEFFGLQIPQTCPLVPNELLNPRATWADDAAYCEQAQKLAVAFHQNFEKFVAQTDPLIVAGGPLAGNKPKM